MSFGIFSIPIMRLLIETYDWVEDSNGQSVLRRYPVLKWGSFQQVLLFAVALIAMLIQLISSIVFINITKDDVFDEYGNFIHQSENADEIETIEINELEIQQRKESAVINFFCKRKRFKKGVKYLPVITYLIQIVLVVIWVFSPNDHWLPSLAWELILITLICYFLKTQPYADNRYNNWNMALLFSNMYTFLRSFLINLYPESNFVVSIASYSIFLTPVFFIFGYFVSAFRAMQLKYDESDDYDEIRTKPDAKNKRNLKYANIIIDLIIELKLKGVRIQSIYVKSVRKKIAIAHGIFWWENEIGFRNAAILLAYLWDQSNNDIIYFSKLSFRNIEYKVENLEILSENWIKDFWLCFYAGIFRYLTHLEMHNFVLYEHNFMYIIAIIQNSPIIEVIDIHHNEFIDLQTDVMDEDFIEALRKRYENTGELFEIKKETKLAIWHYLQSNTVLRKFIQ